MAKLPEPPPAAALARLPPAEKGLPAGSLLWRVYFRGGSHPTLWQAFRRFGPLGGRFDHHLPDAAGKPRFQRRGIYYAALDLITGLAEVFQLTRVIDRDADEPWVVGFELAAPVRLLDLTGTWPTRAGASMAIHSGPRPRVRRWSRTIYEASRHLDGIYSTSSMHAHQPVVSLYERAAGALPPRPVLHRPLSDPALLAPLSRTATELGYHLV